MYTLMPFQFARHSVGDDNATDDVLMVNECGDFLFVSAEDFDLLVRFLLPKDRAIFHDLKAKLFLVEGDTSIALRKTAAKYRSRKAFLRDFTSLHMMVITLRCNQKCAYCQASCAPDNYSDSTSGSAKSHDMDTETAEQVIDMIFQSPSKSIKIEFQGGEPLLNWSCVTHSVLYAEHKNRTAHKDLSFVLCTNLIGITEEHLLFCKEHNICISTSLDGPAHIHDACRILRTGGGTYALFQEKLALSRAICGTEHVNALMTTSAYALDSLEDIINEYMALGLDGIFIRSLNPYGFAAEEQVTLGYSMERFVDAYLRALRSILKKNEEVYFPEYFATLLFSRILTAFSTGFVDLQSPSGAGISGVIYDFDGSVFPTDEARMLAQMSGQMATHGDSRHFCLGNVKTDSYAHIFAGEKLRRLTEGACLETTPHCAHCVYQAYCGTDPIRNYLESGEEVRNMSETHFCIKHKGIFDGLFSILKNASDAEQAIIWSWIRGCL